MRENSPNSQNAGSAGGKGHPAPVGPTGVGSGGRAGALVQLQVAAGRSTDLKEEEFPSLDTAADVDRSDTRAAELGIGRRRDPASRHVSALPRPRVTAVSAIIAGRVQLLPPPQPDAHVSKQAALFPASPRV